MNIMRVAILLFVICWSVISHGQDDRARFVPPDEIVWLKDATEKDVQYLALQLEPLRSFERGQFVALPDWGLHPLQSSLIKSSYHEASKMGWRSWGLTPPSMHIQPTSLAHHTPDSEFTQPDDNALEPYRAALFKRLEALNEKVSQHPGFVVWLVEGISGALWIDWINKNPSAAPDAVILLDVYLPQPALNRVLGTKIAKLTFPVLDIKSASANRWVAKQWSMHETLSQKYQQLSYRPRSLLTRPPEAANELKSVIQGWFKFHGF
ncbi:DUF3530 family protein [Idiomarina baltica]|jgi:hypothetical protein|uniref:DUF3530 family protein n=1 Tax=Idiomarina baltica TaxID=190892 RepID=UPI000C3FF383|nr:DUF3530 family protein [Idiomarina baltica]MBR38429.1 hypothetical protein [Idiomarina sp.]|tara:strand:+ start:4923 stop:5717 length:795 start_codon:yes stop_codon:yes gene_type:complete